MVQRYQFLDYDSRPRAPAVKLLRNMYFSFPFLRFSCKYENMGQSLKQSDGRNCPRLVDGAWPAFF